MNKIAVVGCGAVGLNYGTRLLEAELFTNSAIKSLDVSLVVRRDHALLTSYGVRVKYGHEGSDDETRADDLVLTGLDLKDKLFLSTEDLFHCKGYMSWVIVCCKSYSISDQLMTSLQCISDESTKFLIIMNGLNVESSFAQWFGAERVFGGLSKIACNRGPNPPTEQGPLILHCFADISLEIGHMLDDELLLGDARQLFANTAISSIVHVTNNLLKSRWSKLCWNLAFTGISVAMGGLTCDVIVGDASLRTLAARVIVDVVRVANADLRRQHEHRTQSSSQCTDLLPEAETVDALLAITEKAGAYKTSTVLDLVGGRPLEVQYLFDVPLQQARHLQTTFDNSLHFEHLESVILMVLAVAGLSIRKRAAGMQWQPVFFSGDIA